MDRATALAKLAKHKPELESLGVRSLSLFGSVARDCATVHSDVDLLVEFNAPIGFFEFYAVKERLEQILGASVDLVTRNGLKPRMRSRVLAEAARRDHCR